MRKYSMGVSVNNMVFVPSFLEIGQVIQMFNYDGHTDAHTGSMVTEMFLVGMETAVKLYLVIMMR